MTAEQSSEVDVIDVATLKVTKKIALVTDKADTSAKPKKPMGIILAKDGARVFVSTGRGGTVDVIDVATLAVTGSVKAGARPWGPGPDRRRDQALRRQRPLERRLRDRHPDVHRREDAAGRQDSLGRGGRRRAGTPVALRRYP